MVKILFLFFLWLLNINKIKVLKENSQKALSLGINELKSFKIKADNPDKCFPAILIFDYLSGDCSVFVS